MKLKCTQCGAFIAVTSPDAYVTCSYCDARAEVTGFTGQSFLHRPVLSEEDAVRLFPSGSVASASVYWFPYNPSDLSVIFTQPYPEMEEYTPPSADRRMWEEKSAEGSVIPVDPDLVGEEGVIYHPFWMLTDSSSGQGIMVDAVSGVVIGASSEAPLSSNFNPFRTAAKAFAVAVIPALIIFFLLRELSLFWASVAGMAAAVFAPDLWDRIHRSEK